LDEGLEEVSLRGIVPHGVPQPFEDLVTFPPIGEIVEINSIEIVSRSVPFVGGEWRWFRLRQSIGMSAWITAWMWGPSGHEMVWGEWTG
jgi:hypothetical protein